MYDKLSRKENRYVNRHLREANEKINRLLWPLFHVRSLEQAKKNLELYLTVRKIHSNVKKDPKLFFKIEGFFYQKLDSLVEIAERYSRLFTQPAKSEMIKQKLSETEEIMAELTESVKQDLYIILDKEVDILDFELDVAKKWLNRTNKRKGGSSDE